MPAKDQTPLGGDMTVSKMIGDNVEIDSVGNVTGTIHYVTDVPQYAGEQANGHFFPIEFQNGFYGKKLHVGGEVSADAFEGGKVITPSHDDPYLVIRVENLINDEISIFDEETKDELLKLNFSDATKEPSPGLG